MRKKWLDDNPIGEATKKKESELGIVEGKSSRPSDDMPSIDRINRSLKRRGVQ